MFVTFRDQHRVLHTNNRYNQLVKHASALNYCSVVHYLKEYA